MSRASAAVTPSVMPWVSFQIRNNWFRTKAVLPNPTNGASTIQP